MTKKNSVIFGLILIATSIIAYKVLFLKITPRSVVPVREYEVKIKMKVTGHGEAIDVQTLLPKTDERQTILNENSNSGPFAFSSHIVRGNRMAEWKADSVQERQNFEISYTVRPQKVVYELPSFAQKYAAPDSIDLIPTERIQSRDLKIKNLNHTLGIDTLKNTVEILRRVYAYTSENIKNAKFSGETDALTALALGEASCNGKSRLAVAMLRASLVPARLVGGLILKQGKKKTSHQWVEALIGNQWVPFCPLNKHFAEIPENYLVVYRNDESLFSRTKNVGFDYNFEIKSSLAQRIENNTNLNQFKYLDLLYLWDKFAKVNMPIDLFKVILMIPFGALIIVIFRNVIGLKTFGVFLPILIATAYRSTGLMWGHIGFIFIFMVGIVIRFFLKPFDLLHTPKLSIILVFVIGAMLGLGVLGAQLNMPDLAHATLFPIAIMTLTAERFFIVAEENSLSSALTTLFNSLIVITFCYLAMLSEVLQMVVLVFPEVMLFVIAANLYLGSWTELRILEIWRFRHILFKEKTSLQKA